MTSQTIGAKISVQQCSKSFKNQRVLEPLDLHIEAGTTLVLLGPSGCGKTTTLRLIAGLETPDSGTIFFDNKNVTSVPIERRNVGMVFQSYALFPNMTVRQNIAYGLAVRKVPLSDQTARVREMLTMMQIESLADRQIDKLSGGQKQRVALARAIAPRPRVLLLDEPLTALDAQLRETLRVEINSLLRGLGITTVYVTHDQSEAMALGDQVAVMNRGAIAQLGSPQDIYFHPENSFVAEFIGTLNVVSQRRFRPEDVSLVTPELADIRGHVISSIFLGDHQRVRFQCSSSEQIVLKLPPRLSLKPGDTLGLAIHSTDNVAS